MTTSPPRSVYAGRSHSGRGVALLIEALRGLGVDPSPILARARICESTHSDPDARIPAEQGLAFWQAAQEVAGDTDFGLHMGERVGLDQLDLVGYLMYSATDGLEAARKAQRFAPLLSNAATVEYGLRGSDFVVTFRIEGSYQSETRSLEEFMAVLILTVSRQLLNAEIQPIEVRFRHAKPANTAEHERIFRARLVFGMAESALVFDRKAIDEPLPIVTADPRLSQILEGFAGRRLEELPPQNDFVALVRHMITAELADGDTSAKHIATRLHMSVSTLRRKLGESGFGHKNLLEDLRRELALRYLREEHLEIGEVAYLLGFSQASAFHRAFKRWTGFTPDQVRKGT